MFQRVIQQHDAITTTLCLMDKNEMCLTAENIETLKQIVGLLEPFEVVTREISSEQYISVSKIIPLARSLQQIMATSTSISIQAQLHTNMSQRFRNIEGNLILASATFTDTHFKKIGLC